jgi:hypothetical protein
LFPLEILLVAEIEEEILVGGTSAEALAGVQVSRENNNG